MSSDLKKALLTDGSALSLLALAHIERHDDIILECGRQLAIKNAEIDLMADMGVTKIVAPNINCILALEEAGMPSAASVLRRMK
jgi:hypothetical protein